MAQNHKSLHSKALDPSFLVAAIATVAFYAMVNRPSMRDTLLYHYTTEHIVEYVIVALFIWGIVDVALKLLSFPKEFWALSQDWLPARTAREPVANAQTLLDQLAARPVWLQHSRVGVRLIQALGYVRERGSVQDYREYLEYLAEQDDDRTYSSYTLMRFAAAVTPVLGLVGTVVHFGTALSGISFDQMAERLQTVVSEMGTAFNTTTVALAAAITMMFSMFICERIEHGIVRSIDRLVERELLHRFESHDPNVGPYLSAMRTAHEETLRGIASTLQRQIATWTQTLDSLFQRFDARQQQELRSWEKALDVLQQRHEAIDAKREERFQKIAASLDARHPAQQAQILALVERVCSIKEELRQTVDALRNIAQDETTLIQLQATLTENLRLLNQSQQIEDALHGLTAAIHLLTARQRAGASSHQAA